MTGYTVLAELYDGLMRDFPYKDYIGFILQHAAKGRGLDLFCGSGRVTTALAQAGFTMQGSDISAEMLNIAVRNASTCGESIIFRRESAENFAYTHKLDLITAVCDGINYLTYKQALKLFLRIKQALLIGGVFIFDVSSRYKLTKILANNTFFYDQEDLTYIWQSVLTKKKNAIDFDISFFLKRDNFYERGDEKHRQYVHGVPDLKRALREAGLNLIKIADGESFKAANPKSRRVVFVVKNEK